MRIKNRGAVGRRFCGLAATAALGIGLATAALAEDAASPVVGSWIVKVTVEGSPSLSLPNLVTFGADGTVTAAPPPILPELPGGIQEHFSAGHGAWVANGGGTDMVMAFLVTDDAGALLSINTVRGALAVDAHYGRYIGQFKLAITAPDGSAKGSGAGTWQALKIDPAATSPVTMPK